MYVIISKALGRLFYKEALLLLGFFRICFALRAILEIEIALDYTNFHLSIVSSFIISLQVK